MSLEKLIILNGELDGVYHTDRVNQRAVVFVHGILGDKATTWGLRKELLSFDYLVASDPPLTDYDVFAFGYRAGLWRGSRIELLAKHLRAGIDELLRKGREDLTPSRNYRLVLIAHSMGGLVCMRYLLDCLQEGNRPPVIGLVLYGTPTTGTDLVRLANLAVTGIALKIPVVRWVASLWRRRQQQFDDMATASRFLTGLHDQWALRVVNGGHPTKVDRKGRMWLPVRVVTAEDELYVSEASAKGMYGAVDWQTVACSHTALVKPTSTTDLSYVHARTFLQMARKTDRPVVEEHVWNLSQTVWQTYTNKMISNLEYDTDIHSTLAKGGTPDPDLASAGLTACRVLCKYRGVLEADPLMVGISFGTIGQDDVWQPPEPVCVHSVLLRSVRPEVQEQIEIGLKRVMARPPEQAWTAFFPALTVLVNGTSLTGGIAYHGEVPPHVWLRRPFPLPKKLKSLVGEEVDIVVDYQSVVPAALNVFRFRHRWLTHGSRCRITVNGEFDYFIPGQHLAIGQQAKEKQETLPTRRTVQFQTTDVMLPGATFEVNWQRIAQPPVST